MSNRTIHRFLPMPTETLMLTTSMRWYFTSYEPYVRSVGLSTCTDRVTTEEFVDPRSNELMHTAGGMDVVSPHRSVPLADVPLFKTVLGRRFEDELEKLP